ERKFVRTRWPRIGPQIKFLNPRFRRSLITRQTSRSPLGTGQFFLKPLGIQEMQTLRKIRILSSLTFARAIHFGPTENGQEIRIAIETIVRKLHGLRAQGLARKLRHHAADPIDRIE